MTIVSLSPAFTTYERQDNDQDRLGSGLQFHEKTLLSRPLYLIPFRVYQIAWISEEPAFPLRARRGSSTNRIKVFRKLNRTLMKT